jgi:uncharacterized protein involved in outer membrane biogenesis
VKAKTGKVVRVGIAAVFFVLLAGLAIGAAALALYDWNNARDWISAKVTKKTGRVMVIAGDLRVRLFSLNPSLRAERVTFANADWGEEQPMLEADAIGLSVSLTRLLVGEVVLPLVELDNARVLLERHKDGRRNWILKPPEKTDQGKTPRIEQLAANNSTVTVKDKLSETEMKITAQSQPNEEIYGLKVSATGRVRGVPLNVKGDSGALLKIMDEVTPYPVRLEGTLGDSRFSARGTLTGVATQQSLDVDMTLTGGNLAPLGEVLKLSLPHTKPYRLSGALQRRGTDWNFKQVRGQVGASDLGGDVTVATGGTRPKFTANLHSKSLDIADLGGFVGTRPGKSEETRPPGKLIPSETIDLDKLRRIDAHVRLVATHFKNADKLPLDNLDATLLLDDGVLRFDPVKFGVAKGSVKTSVRVDARKPVIAASVDARFDKLLLSNLIPSAKKLDESFGAVNGRLRLAGRGNSPARQLASSSGRVDLYSTGGETSNLLMEFAGADIAEIAKFWIGGDQKVQLRCAILSFQVKEGVAASEVLVVDTDDTIIGGTGAADLRQEKLDFKLTPLPKDMSILSLRGPLVVGGSFQKPTFGLEKTSLARKIGASVLLALVNPIAAMIPLIETGPGKDAACNDLVAQVEKSAEGVIKQSRR